MVEFLLKILVSASRSGSPLKSQQVLLVTNPTLLKIIIFKCRQLSGLSRPQTNTQRQKQNLLRITLSFRAIVKNQKKNYSTQKSPNLVRMYLEIPSCGIDFGHKRSKVKVTRLESVSALSVNVYSVTALH